MKILQVNNVYDFGSTGRITRDIHQSLRERRIDSVVYYGRRYETGDPGVTKFCSEAYAKANHLRAALGGLMYGGCALSTARLEEAIRREKPDVVHLQCLNGFFVNIYRLLDFLKREKIPTVLTLHAEFMYTANCGYALECEKWRSGCGGCPRLRQETGSLLLDRTADSWQEMKAAFDGFDRLAVVSVSPWLEERAKASTILRDKRHVTVLNGLDTGCFRPGMGAERRETREKYGIPQDKRVLFYATPNFNPDPTHIKGAYYILRLAELVKGSDLHIVVAGSHEASLQVPENVQMLGSILDRREMAALYSQADLTVLTSRKETFSMICAESLCCGTPVAGFRAGAPELISLPAYSRFVAPADTDALLHAAEELLDARFTREQVAREAAERYSVEHMVEAYLEIYRSM